MQELLKHFHELSLHPKNAKELKGLILQLAIQGKLTAEWRAQNPELISGKNNAEYLLKEIRKEKAKLVKENKIKKEKNLPPIPEDEVPYRLPESWAWCRLMETTEYIQRGKSPKYSEVQNIPVVSQKCVQWSGFDISKARFITEESLEKYQDERFLVEGDLLWNSTGNGTIGRTILLPKLEYDQIVADSHVTVVRPFRRSLISEYLWLYSASPLVQKTIEGRVSGSTKQTELGTSTVKELEFALPPFEEQKVIVKTVEKLFKEVEVLENLTEKRVKLKKDYATSALNQLTKNDSNAGWQALKPQFHAFFNEVDNIKKLRETILQLAVQGKLTAKWRAQNPELISGDNSAANLLKEIKAEKVKLTREKKIKKEKVLPPITADEIPYELPEGWVWCRMGAISEIQRGSSPRPKGDPRYFSDIRTQNHWISIKDITKNTRNNILLDTEEFLTDLGTEFSRYADKNELIVAVSGSTTGKSCLTGIEGYIYDGLALVRFLNTSVDRKYHLLYMLQLYNHMNDSKFGAAFPNINTKFLNEMMFPFPSLEEQKSIVQKVDLLMNLCDQLEGEIETGQQQIEDLMQSVLKEIFEGDNKINEVSVI